MPQQTGKEALLTWCQRCTDGFAGVHVVDFHMSWKDGLAFCALIARFRPDKLDFSKLSKDDPAHNLALAFKVAEELGIAPLLDVEDITSLPKPEMFSIMTYLSQFFHHFSKPENMIIPPSLKPATAPAAQPAAAAEAPSPQVEVAKLATKPCSKCGETLSGDVIEACGRYFHARCFGCFGCGKKLQSEYLTVADGAYCEACGRKAFLKRRLEVVSGKFSAQQAKAQPKPQEQPTQQAPAQPAQIEQPPLPAKKTSQQPAEEQDPQVLWNLAKKADEERRAKQQTEQPAAPSKPIPTPAKPEAAEATPTLPLKPAQAEVAPTIPPKPVTVNQPALPPKPAQAEATPSLPPKPAHMGESMPTPPPKPEEQLTAEGTTPTADTEPEAEEVRVPVKTAAQAREQHMKDSQMAIAAGIRQRNMQGTAQTKLQAVDIETMEKQLAEAKIKRRSRIMEGSSGGVCEWKQLALEKQNRIRQARASTTITQPQTQQSNKTPAAPGAPPPQHTCEVGRKPNPARMSMPYKPGAPSPVAPAQPAPAHLAPAHPAPAQPAPPKPAVPSPSKPPAPQTPAPPKPYVAAPAKLGAPKDAPPTKPLPIVPASPFDDDDDTSSTGAGADFNPFAVDEPRFEFVSAKRLTIMPTHTPLILAAGASPASTPTTPAPVANENPFADPFADLGDSPAAAADIGDNPFANPFEVGGETAPTDNSDNPFADLASAPATSNSAPTHALPPTPSHAPSYSTATDFAMDFDPFAALKIKEKEEEPPPLPKKPLGFVSPKTPLQEGVLAGVLWKQDTTSLWPTWQERYFELQEGRFLVYFKEPRGQTDDPMGSIDLYFALHVEPYKHREKTFEVITAERNYLLEAFTEEDMFAWIRGIALVIHTWKEKKMKQSTLPAGFIQLSEQKQGWLHRLTFLRQWKKCWVVMKGGVIFYFSQPGGAASGKIALYHAELAEYDPEYTEFAFEVKTNPQDAKPKSLVLKGSSVEEMHSWLNSLIKQKLAIEDMINSLQF
eukprot:TRINITY_DN1917_c0_g1_i1.p1 TRINITY_DN1917_c0_g1~~TRINITY_DN1917_c0_g1_i1.p1  ORF type:complete len:1022 (-),score=241.17 TRINITY_DN1917_c0_g1_i1:1730-4744(-)